MLRAVARKPKIVMVGAGNLGSALAVALRGAGYPIESIVVVARSRGSLKKARTLAAKVGATARTGIPQPAAAQVIWFAVPDGEIARVARLAAGTDWRRVIALHSSGALTSDELDVLRRRGASVASVHPLMTFVRGARRSLSEVPFAIEGDPAAVRMSRRLVDDMGGRAYGIRKSDKPAYHAWATFASPLFDALLATSERVAAVAGVSSTAVKRRMLPILRQTLANYAVLGAPEAFSGPIVRGDVETIRRHLDALRSVPPAREVYVALAKAALRYLPAKRRKDLMRILSA
jgi:predicted short-subunit dehydrogenase-like oxidoreductase (DUF2520 family)